MTTKVVMRATRTTRLIKRVFEAVARVVETTQIEFTEEGVSLNAMCNTNVSLCTLKLKPTAFAEYTCRATTTVGVTLKYLNQALATVHDDDPLTLRITDREDVLTVESSGGRRDVVANVHLVTITSELLEVPPISYPASIVLDAAEFERSLRDLQCVGDIATVEIDARGVAVSTTGDVGTLSLRLNAANTADDAHARGTRNGEGEKEKATAWDAKVISDAGKERGDYALTYLARFARASTTSAAAQLCLGGNAPLRVRYLLKTDHLADRDDDDVADDDDDVADDDAGETAERTTKRARPVRKKAKKTVAKTVTATVGTLTFYLAPREPF